MREGIAPICLCRIRPGTFLSISLTTKPAKLLASRGGSSTSLGEAPKRSRPVTGSGKRRQRSNPDTDPLRSGLFHENQCLVVLFSALLMSLRLFPRKRLSANTLFFIDHVMRIGCNILELLNAAAGPADFQRVRFVVSPQSEMRPRVAG
jgi:hypothetical protein